MVVVAHASADDSLLESSGVFVVRLIYEHTQKKAFEALFHPAEYE
jgi:hypothetical protein